MGSGESTPIDNTGRPESSTSKKSEVEDRYLAAYFDIKQILDRNTRLLEKISTTVDRHDVQLRAFEQRMRTLEVMQRSPQQPSNLVIKDSQMIQIVDFLGKFLPKQMMSIMKENKTNLCTEINRLKATHQRMLDTGVGCTSLQVYAMLAHLLKKVEDIRQADSVLVQKISQVETNMDILNARQLRCGKDLNKVETTIRQLQILSGQTDATNQGPSSLVDSDDGEAKDDEEYGSGVETADSESVSSKSGQGEPELFNAHPDAGERSHSNRGPGNKRSWGRRGRGRGLSNASRQGKRSIRLERPSGGFMDLNIFNLNKFSEGKYLFTDQTLHISKLGGDFKGHVRSCQSGQFVFSLLFEPERDQNEFCAVDSDQMFHYKLIIIHPSGGGCSWFVFAETISLSSLRKTKWGRANGFEMGTLKKSDLVGYVSEKGCVKAKLIVEL